MRYVDFMIEKYGEELAMELIEELTEWRDIDGYNGQYRVNEWGDVMSLKWGKKKMLKTTLTSFGYYAIDLCDDKGRRKKHMVHRLVATAFCEGAGEFEVVNHIDEDKTNNHYSNLEWCTVAYNNAYGSREQTKANNFKKRKVRCVELDIVFNSMMEAAKYVNGKNRGISDCLHGRISTHRGYHWEFVD